MKNIKLLIGAATILSASAFTIINLINWKVKDDYSVKFSSGHLEGNFKGLKTAILFDEANPEKSKITASIDATTIKTGSGEADGHVKEALSTDKFPVITFVSIAVSKTGSGYEATGNLTLRGVTKIIKFPFFFDSKKTSNRFPFVDKETFNGKITIAPKDFNVTRQGTPAEVYIDLTIPVAK
jgi:polyisoprenoid-binding protein YceI